jgi:hypothetical protein
MAKPSIDCVNFVCYTTDYCPWVQPEEWMMKRAPERAKQPRPVSGKRPYKRPRLIEYGSVAKLTAGPGSIIIADGRSGMGMP